MIALNVMNDILQLVDKKVLIVDIVSYQLSRIVKLSKYKNNWN